MKIEGLKSVEFLDDSVLIRGRRVSFHDIRSVRFLASETKHSMNGVPTGSSYESNMTIYLSSGEALPLSQDWALRSATQGKHMGAMQRAYAIVSGMTFRSRVRAYERAQSRDGHFLFGGFAFGADGVVSERGSPRFSLRDKNCRLSLEYQYLSVAHPNKDGFLKSVFPTKTTKIDILTDKDCVLYLLRKHHSITFRGVSYAEPVLRSKREIQEAILTISTHIMGADGEISKKELDEFKRYYSIDSKVIPNAAAIFNEALANPRSLRSTCQEIFSSFSDNPDHLESIFLGLCLIAGADGTISEAEYLKLDLVRSAFGLPEGTLRDILIRMGFGARSTGRDERSDHRPQDIMDKMLEVLGLIRGATASSVRSAYLSLVKKHHPDRLRGIGLSEAAIKRNEEILKTINAAYEWLTARLA